MNRLVIITIVLSLLISCKPFMAGKMAVKTVEAPIALFTPIPPAKDITFGWMDINTVPLKGFKLYIYRYGCADYVLERTIEIPGGAVRTYTIKNFKDTYKSQWYSFELTAVALDGQESAHSDYVEYTNN